jgi:hypothetical protein
VQGVDGERPHLVPGPTVTGLGGRLRTIAGKAWYRPSRAELRWTAALLPLALPAFRAVWASSSR